MAVEDNFCSVGHDYPRKDAGYVLPRPTGSFTAARDELATSGLVRLRPEGVGNGREA